MKFLSIDCETIPHQDLPEGCVPQFDPDDIKYGNAGPEKRAEKAAKCKAEFNEKLDKKMSTDPALCQVCTFVGITYDTDEGETVNTVSYQMDNDPDDLDIVIDAWECIQKAYNERIPIVTFNGIEFDLPVLRFRAMALDIPVNPVMYEKLTYRYPTPHHYDLMARLGRYKVEKGKDLDFYLRLFGIGSKGDFDGSMVYPTWKDGKYEIIQKYCEDDVLKTAKLFERVEPWIKQNYKEG